VPRRPQAFVAFAIIGVEEGSIEPDDLAGALDEALTPGKRVTRYGRMWRLPQHSVEGDWIVGRVGFEYPASVGLWNETQKDFLSIKPSQVTPYVIHGPTGRVAFELKSSTIKAWTFQGNFQALLNQKSGYRWKVTLEGVSQPPWEEWERSMARITDVRIKMHRPNPRYPGKEIERMFEMAKLNAATIAAQGDGIELSESELLKEAFALARNGYGTITAKGISRPSGTGPDGKKEEWRSEAESETERERAVRDPVTQEVPVDQMKQLLEQREAESPE
jgi:hypothetical protein